jgi:uncharacterized protein (DUF885 family)
MDASTNPQVARVDAAASRAWERMIERSTYLRVQAGLPVEFIASGSPAEIEEDASDATTLLDELAAIDGTGLDHDHHLTREVLRHLAEERVRQPGDHWLHFSVTPYNSAEFTYYAGEVFGSYRFDQPADGDRYQKLVSDLAARVRQMAATMAEQDRRGIRLPAPALRGTLATLEGHRTAIETAVRLRGNRVRAAGSVVADAVDRLVDAEVLPAFDALLGFLTGDYRARLPEAVGIGQYPGGAEVYARLVRRHTTLDLSPEQVHATGLEQVERITAEMAEVRAGMGFAGTEADFHEHLAALPRLFDRDPAEVEARFDEYMRRLEPALPGYFSVLPRAPYGVKRLEPELEPGMTYGYYEAPNPARPIGLYRFNASDLERRSMLWAAALIYHELAPGHHFHIARQRENARLPSVRRELFDFTAYTEGWAEYASNLVREMGLMDDYDIYGRLVHERFTSQRLVIDTGMNALGWSLDRARAFMRATTVESDLQVSSETLRYSTDMPGQALAYRVGFLEFMDLREGVRRRLGAAFDLPAFHEAILGAAAMPMSLLRDHLDWFVSQPAR